MKPSRASVRRHGWVVPASLIIVLAAAVIVSQATHTSYRSTAVLVVPITASVSSGPLAAAAPATYADVIAQDDAVATVVARAVRSSAAAVRPGISATQATDTSIIDVAFTSTSAQFATAGATAIVRAVTGSSPVTRAIPAGALQIVREASAAVRTSRHTAAEAVPIGIVLGLLLGIGFFLAWDRHDARADDAELLEREIGLPVTEFVEGASADSLRVVEERWRQIAGVDDPGIAFVGVTHDGAAAAHSICTSLGVNTSRAGATYVAAGAPDDADDTATIDTRAADVVVLIAARGDRVRAIRDVNGSLHKLGVEPRWVLLTDRA